MLAKTISSDVLVALVVNSFSTAVGEFSPANGQIRGLLRLLQGNCEESEDILEIRKLRDWTGFRITLNGMSAMIVEVGNKQILPLESTRNIRTIYPSRLDGR